MENSEFSKYLKNRLYEDTIPTKCRHYQDLRRNRPFSQYAYAVNFCGFGSLEPSATVLSSIFTTGQSLISMNEICAENKTALG